MTLATHDLSTIWYALGWSTLHFLWQGAIIGLLTFAALRYVRRPETRYLVACGAMAACLLCFIATALFLVQSINSLPVLVNSAALATAISTLPLLRSISTYECHPGTPVLIRPVKGPYSFIISNSIFEEPFLET